MEPAIGVLGPVVIRRGAVRSRLQRVLVAALVAHRTRSCDQLIEALWGLDGTLPKHPEAALQSQVHRLRRQLEDTGVDVLTEAAGYRLSAAPGAVDADRFETVVADADDVDVLTAALDLWRGRAYGNVADHPAVVAHAAHLEERRLEARQQLARLLLQGGRTADAADAADALQRDEPYREEPVELRMRALTDLGQHVEAGRTFEAFRRRLADELGLEPSPELRRLHSALLRHDRPAAIGVPGNTFVGRAVDVAGVAELLGAGRLVTLTGPGGVGKTRLAAHVAARVHDRFPDGTYLCTLATVTDGVMLASAIASSLRIDDRAGGRLEERVLEFLRPQRALLVLDNCEHVRAEVSDLVRRVLARAPETVVLATSRERLGVEGEHVHPVLPLPLPDGDLLLRQRAVAAGATTPTGEREQAALVELSRRLDGLPLAIELAAAHLRSCVPSELLGAIGDRLERLGDERRDVERHRSVDATVQWSYDQLDADGQAAFRAMSVFAGGCTAPALAAVLDRDPTRDLRSLVERSLIHLSPSPGGSRYSMLEPVRHVAQARLEECGELLAVRRQHAAWATSFAEASSTGLRSSDDAAWVRAVDAELANLRAAHRWLLQHSHDRGGRLVGALFWYAYLFGPAELLEWTDATVEESVDETVGASALGTAALGAWRRGDFPRARDLADRSIALAGDDVGVARFAWEARRSAELLSGNRLGALRCRDEAIAGARAVDDEVHEAHALVAGALALGYLGRVEEADRDLAEARRLLAGRNIAAGAFCDYVTGEIRVESDPAAALPYLERARDAAWQVGSRFIASIAGASAASCTARIGDPAEAVAQFNDVIEQFRRLGAWPQLQTTMRGLNQAEARLRAVPPSPP